MPKVKYGTKKYSKAYEDKSIVNYDPSTDTYNTSIPLEQLNVTPQKNLDLGQVVRNGTEPIGKTVGTTVTELAALHPIIGIAKAGLDASFAKTIKDQILTSLSALPVPVIRNLSKSRKIIYPITRKVSKVEPE